MKRARLRSIVCALALAVSACTGTETGNPSFTGTLEYHAYSSAPRAVSVALSVDDDSELKVSSAWLVLGAVDFVPSDECDPTEPSRVHAHALGAGDHAQSIAAKTEVELEAGSYCGVRLPFLRSGTDVGSAPAALANNSMLIEGTLGDGRKFQLRSSMQADVFLKAVDDSFELDESSKVVLIGFDVAVWLRELDLSTATANTDGVVEIAEGVNDALLTSFESRVAAGVALYLDADADGSVDADAAPLASGAD